MKQVWNCTYIWQCSVNSWQSLKKLIVFVLLTDEARVAVDVTTIRHSFLTCQHHFVETAYAFQKENATHQHSWRQTVASKPAFSIPHNALSTQLPQLNMTEQSKNVCTTSHCANPNIIQVTGSRKEYQFKDYICPCQGLNPNLTVIERVS